METWDVLVVGGGPAGSTTAISAKKANPSLRIAIVDKSHFPRDKSCGDGLGPGVIKVLESLDALEVVEGCLKPDAVFVGGPEGWEGFAEGPTIRGRDLSGYVVPRVEFDNRLLNHARNLGVEVLEGMEFRGSRLDSDAPYRVVDLKSMDQGEDRVVGTRFLVGADGAYSRVRRALGVRTQDKEFTHVATRAYVDFSDGDQSRERFDALRIDFESNLLPAYGWLFPISRNRANVGIGIPVELLREKDASLNSLLEEYLEALRARGIAVGSPESVKTHQLPHAARMPALAYPRAALVGDAASMINSLSGEGIAYGMAAGEMLGRYLAVPSNLVTSKPLLGFHKEFRRRFGLHLWSCWIAHRFLRSPWWATRVIKAASKDQVVMDDAAQLLFDEQRMKLGTGLRIAARGL